MGQITRSLDWSQNILGVPESWPQSLRTTISIILNSKFPMFLFWGSEAICFYNDAYRPSLGKAGKHPAVGMRGKACFPEIWKDIGPLIDQVLNGGEATWNEDLLLPIYRNGKLEDVYWTFSYSPVSDESGQPAGVFVTCSETTAKVKFQQENLENQASLHAMNEKFALVNQELASINEEMLATNEELTHYQQTLVLANSKLSMSEDELRLAIEAGELATFDLNPESGRFTGNSRLKEWFGLESDQDIPLEQATNVIELSYRENVVKAISQAMDYRFGGKYDIEYVIVHPELGTKRFVRAAGKVMFNAGIPVRFSGILQDITEQKRDELRKNDFIGMVSHELKTPLTSLKAYIQVLQGKAKKSEDAFLIGALDKASQQIKKMTGMISGFLNISRLESGKIMINKEEFNLENLLLNIVDEITLTVSSHLIQFVPCQPVIIFADREKIESVIINLLNNAVKYSPQGKKITVSCALEGKNARVSVKDEGIGIAGADQDKLFERYYRVENAQTKTVSGFGIGLYLSAEIVHRHEGQIWVESELGRGSNFIFVLPLK